VSGQQLRLELGDLAILGADLVLRVLECHVWTDADRAISRNERVVWSRHALPEALIRQYATGVSVDSIVD
jgi:hypothetical protein